MERSDRETEARMRRTWTTKDGTKLKIRNMETSHIKNCIRMLERYHERLTFISEMNLGFLTGEMAIEVADNAMMDLERNEFNFWGDDADEFILAFEQELEKRETR